MVAHYEDSLQPLCHSVEKMENGNFPNDVERNDVIFLTEIPGVI